jgi:DNA adenine methylase
MSLSQTNNKKGNIVPIEPFLRWAGGKGRLVKKLTLYLPKDISKRKYIEPFVGAGSLFLALQPQKALISDSNEHLINTYKYIRKNPDLIHTYLSQHAKKTSEKYYYQIRIIYNRSKPSAAQAARFIYLNKTCFNGIFRVNMKGEFNVPYGWKHPPFLPSLHHLRRISKVLKSVKIVSHDYQKALKKASSKDFIYLDPPYPPLNGTSYFTHYTTNRFCEDDQMKLAKLFSDLDSKRCKLMMSNADMGIKWNILYGIVRKRNFIAII